MRDLAPEGLVEVARNKGCRVTAVSERELDELAATRLLLEVPTMGAVAANLTDEVRAALEDLRTTADLLERAAASKDLVAYMQLDTEFHTRFLPPHGNRDIVHTVRQPEARSRLHGLERVAQASLP